MRVLLRLFLALSILVLLAGAGAWWWIEATATTPMTSNREQNQVEFRVEKGASLAQVGRELEAAALIRSAIVWRVYARLHTPPAPKAGRHPLRPNMNIPELFAALADTPLSDDVPLTMVEGWRLIDADAALVALKLIEPGAYVHAARDPKRFSIPFPFEGHTLEGYLFPETYSIPPGQLDIDKLVARQLEAFHKRFFVPYEKEIEASGKKLRDLVILASMLEREEPEPSQRPEVAGVLYRRLDLKVPLGVDATSRYMLADWNDRRSFLSSLRDTNDPYNTRHKVGLPPSPIGAPSLPSLLAALRPAQSQFLYYLHDSERRIHFGRTAEEHEANRKKYNVY